MTRFFWNADAADDADFFVLFLNYPAERVLRDLRFICENLREKNADAANDADFIVLFFKCPAERVLRDLVESIIQVSNFRNEVNRFWSSAKKCFPTNRMR